ncbi:Vacuolar protein sorting-associated protein 55 [Coemansia javaensis]|uniref:Vacuolar protein sorting-associated protein 55 n=1 Tax=Coemansia javaensis TaxID=2761396 RepID=A0A9W8LGE3_9FUNG|nr:Vacuolar protein sorting-associated protein 55 [Coemansia javaensis]
MAQRAEWERLNAAASIDDEAVRHQHSILSLLERSHDELKWAHDPDLVHAHIQAIDAQKIAVLSVCLAAGFLLSILSCALYGNWWPLLVVATYALAPAPNAIFGQYVSADPLADASSSVADFGRFLTAVLVVSGFGLPVVLAHAEIITSTAMTMSIVGGVLVYGTIIAYSTLFRETQDF